MGFWITIYKIRDKIPNDMKKIIMDSEEIFPGIYHAQKIFHVDVESLDKLKDFIEENEGLEQKDIVEWNFDEEALKNPSKELGEIVRTRSNYFIMTVFGLEQVAIDKEMVFVDLSLQEISNLIISECT